MVACHSVLPGCESRLVIWRLQLVGVSPVGTSGWKFAACGKLPVAVGHSGWAMASWPAVCVVLKMLCNQLDY